MDSHRISLLGTGLIGDFYTATLHGQRGRDRVEVVYSRSPERLASFQARWDVQETTSDLTAAIEHPDTDVVIVGLPNFLHVDAVERAAKEAAASYADAMLALGVGQDEALDLVRRAFKRPVTS